jgi:antitoxin component YwqK of YwqJK toxin-antitoxin module
MWEHREDGASVWTQWWPNGRKRSESTWRDGRCEGPASVWDRRGELVTAKTFSGGDIVP